MIPESKLKEQCTPEIIKPTCPTISFFCHSLSSGYHDWEYEVYDYYGNYRTKRVWRLKIFSKVYTRNYDDYFA